MIRIGLDFDNTIICYDELFHSEALNRRLIPADIPKSKGSVRDYLRKIGREKDWTELQGIVYGPGIQRAGFFPGVKEFLAFARQKEFPVFIISHKTRFPYLGEKHDLHFFANLWLEKNGFFDDTPFGIPRESVFFELTKADKIKRIRSLECTHFVDDLPEFLGEKEMPETLEKILFDPNDSYPQVAEFTRLSKWEDVSGYFGRAG